MIDIEVTFAHADKQVVIPVRIDPGTTVKHAIETSGILKLFPEIDINQAQVGVFGKLVPLNTPLKSGDRVEIYRSLLIDPKQARRIRAQKKAK